MRITGNKLARITEDQVKIGLCRIIKDGNVFLHASSVLAPIVWNNILGVNFDKSEEHEAYCKRMGVTKGTYVFACEANAYEVNPLIQIDTLVIK